MAKNEVAVRDDAALAALYDAETETGFEDTTSQDFAIPFLKLLQKGTPEADEDNPAYVQGAKAGLFYNTATGEVRSEINVIPCLYKASVVEWAGTEPGSGYAGSHDPGYELNFPKYVKDGKETGKYITPEGHILQDTRYMFCIDAETLEPFIISFSSSQIKKAKAWMTQMGNLRYRSASGQMKLMPMFTNVYNITSAVESGDDYTWRGYKISRVGPITDADVAQAAKAAREMFVASSAAVKPPTESAATAGGTVVEADDDIPF